MPDRCSLLTFIGIHLINLSSEHSKVQAAKQYYGDGSKLQGGGQGASVSICGNDGISPGISMTHRQTQTCHKLLHRIDYVMDYEALLIRLTDCAAVCLSEGLTRSVELVPLPECAAVDAPAALAEVLTSKPRCPSE